jgi:hypothetical protein
VRVMGRVHLGKGTGWTSQTLIKPVPHTRVSGYPAELQRVFYKKISINTTQDHTGCTSEEVPPLGGACKLYLTV